MQKGYFAAAWGDIVNTPSWFSKILRLALVCFVPVFGLIVVYGYAYGWARDIAWNVHRPMNKRIFGNEDNSLYKRGFYILLIGFVFGLVPGVFSCLASFVTGGAAGSFSFVSAGVGLFYSFLFTVLGLLLAFLIQFFVYVGSMRTTIYNTLSAGFQLSKIWAMMRYDFIGLLKIFAIELVFDCIAVALVVLIAALFAPLGITTIFMGEASFSSAFLVALIILSLLLLYVTFFLFALKEVLITRALGYWTRQFRISLWQGQDDPMPFERQYGSFF